MRNVPLIVVLHSITLNTNQAKATFHAITKKHVIFCGNYSSKDTRHAGNELPFDMYATT